MKTDSKEVEGGSDRKLCFSKNERGEVWNDYVERIMNEESDWDYNVEGDAVEGPMVCVNREEKLQALNEVKTGKAPGPSEVGIQVMAEICQKVLDGFGMPAE